MQLHRIAKSAIKFTEGGKLLNFGKKKSRSILQNLQNEIPHCATFAKVTTLRVIHKRLPPYTQKFQNA